MCQKLLSTFGKACQSSALLYRAYPAGFIWKNRQFATNIYTNEFFF